MRAAEGRGELALPAGPRGGDPQPLGVVGIISPWNYPVHLAVALLAGALAAGNGASCRASSPRDGRTAPADHRRRLGARPRGGGGTRRCGTWARPSRRFPSTTWCSLARRVGCAVMRAAAENLVPVTPSSAASPRCWWSRDAPIATAATRVMSGKLFNAGQTHRARLRARPRGEARRLRRGSERRAADLYPTVVTNGDYTSIVNDRHHARLQSYSTTPARRAPA